MDRDESARSPEELGSFDLAKMSEADVAAEIAQRMSRWRRANARLAASPPDATERGPPAGRPADRQPPAPQPTAGQPTPAGPVLDSAMVVRMDRALRLAAGKADEPSADLAALLAEGPNMNAAGMRPDPESRIDHALRRARAIGVSAWQAPAHWPVVASAALIAVAIAGWALMPPDLAAAPEAARQVEAPPAPETPVPPKAAAFAAAMLKPEWRGPALAARLKPTAPAAAPEATMVSTEPPEAARPERGLQGTAPPKAKPQRKPSQTADETRKPNGADDIKGMFDRMFSDGL